MNISRLGFFLAGVVVAHSSISCPPCKTVTTGAGDVSYYLMYENDPRCWTNGCVYTKEGASSDELYCFDVGDFAVYPCDSMGSSPQYTENSPPMMSSMAPSSAPTSSPSPSPTGSSGEAATQLDLVSLSSSPLAKCNDGSTAVYYRPPDSSEEAGSKWMIYLKGGGYCVPGSPLTDITNCNIRCATEPDLCTASTDPDLDLAESGLGDNIGSNDPAKNPAFYDFNKVWIPYCSSDVYSGTRDASQDTDNRVFHGKYIIQAVIADLISNTGITSADQVVMIGKPWRGTSLRPNRQWECT